MNADMNDSMLIPKSLSPLPLGQIRPAGWLLNQLRIQADGLSGHLDEFWPDVADSQWIGGTAEGWERERGPYWLDGVVPLAFLLDDAKLKAKVQYWADTILRLQHDDGWLGPMHQETHAYKYDPWASYIILKAFTQYHEATGDKRVIVAMKKFLRRLNAVLSEHPLQMWSQVRWADLVLSIHWLYERVGEPWLLELAAKLHEQGFDWHKNFADFAFREKTDFFENAAAGNFLATHVVNNAMGIKQPGVWYRQSHDSVDRDAVWQIIDTLDRYHGQATGVFSGDEHLAGLNPSQGTELCAVVEYMFSLEVLLAVLGDPRLADRLERIAFNALPATFKPDMWAHQYVQQANQVVCKISEDRIYTDNREDANIFGLEPNYGCCTANMHQGWPKFTSHLWMKTPDEGLAAIAYAPCVVKTEVKGQPVSVGVDTSYPFKDTIRVTVKAGVSVRFPLYLRVPGGSENAEICIKRERPIQAQAGTFYRIERDWSGATELTLQFPACIRTQTRYNRAVSLERGPLVFALKIGEEWKQVRGETPHADWEVYPTTDWNYALDIDLEHPEKSVSVNAFPLGDCPFSPAGAPVRVRAKGKRVDGWQIEHNAAAPPPESPVNSSNPTEDLELIPYGCTNLRVTEFPALGPVSPQPA